MWWIGALIGLLLGLAGTGSAFIYAMLGAGVGALMQNMLDGKFDALKEANHTLHQQAATAVKDLRQTIARLEAKLSALEKELRDLRGIAPSAIQPRGQTETTAHSPP
jgi:hypothetical protein